VVETASKRLELLHELIPAVSTIALLVNPANATLAQANESEVRAAAVPTVHENREFIAAGGLIGYGGSITDAYRLAGVYAARFLKGERPGELPVEQSTKVEMFLNLKAARALGITVPLPLLGRAHEVIE
jgi:ABC-type uncharacterized transport system substrate-binding protein